MTAAQIAAIYVRVSTSKQEDNYSLPTQEAACREFAQAQGYTVSEAHVYREVHTGTELYERPHLNAAREAMARHEFDVLVCYDPDRFSRNQVHTSLLLDACERAGVILKFAMFDFEESATGRFMLNARLFAAELEVEKFKERSQRGRRGRARSGKLIAGPRPLYGYKFRDEARTGYAIDEETAPIARRIFAELLAGNTLNSIALRLMREGVPSPSGKPRWYRSTIQQIVVNPMYIGEAVGMKWQITRKGGKTTKRQRAQEETIVLPEGVVPPLIDRATFETVREQLRQNKQCSPRNGRNPEAALLRAGLVKCAECGRNLRVAHRRSRGKEMPLYVCNSLTAKDPCTHPAISVKNLDAEIWGRVAAFLQRRDTVQYYREQVARLDGLSDETIAAELAAIERNIADIERRRANLARDLSQFDNPDDAAPSIVAMKNLGTDRAGFIAEREKWLGLREQREAAEEVFRSIDEWCRVVGENLPNLTYAQKRIILEELGIRVKLYPKTAEHRWVADGDAARAILYGSSISSGTADGFATRSARVARFVR